MLELGVKPTVDWDRWRSWENKFALFSGGKDSLVVLHLCKEHYDDLKCIHIDTTCSLPGVLEYVKQICDQLDVPLIIIRPKRSFYELARKWGFPTFKTRWCMKQLKKKPLQDFLRQFGSKVIFDGMRAAESKVRKRMFERRKERGINPSVAWMSWYKCFAISPIWNWTEEQVDAYIRNFELPLNPVAKLFGWSGECLCPVYKNERFFQLLRAKYPEIFQTLLELEASMRKGGSFAYFKNRKFYLKSLLDQKLMTDFL